MNYEKFLLAALVTGSWLPAIVAFMSFVSWENIYKSIGWKYLARMEIATIIFTWIVVFIIDKATL